jgi:hypothetical protein
LGCHTPCLLRPRRVAGSGHGTRTKCVAEEEGSPDKEDPPDSLTLPPPPLFSPRVAADRWTLGPTRQRKAKPLPSALSRRLAGPARECAPQPHTRLPRSADQRARPCRGPARQALTPWHPVVRPPESLWARITGIRARAPARSPRQF